MEKIEERIKLYEKKLDSYKKMNLKLNMARGVPSKAQLDLSMGMMDILDSNSNFLCEDGVDCRSYGGPIAGIPECRRLLASIIEVSEDKIMIFGNSSLNIMFDLVAHAMSKGICGHTPWAKLDKIKWLCPVPGYDRHFSICEYFGIEMINVPMDENGPDMDYIESLVEKDESIKGIWCVPKYANPNGITYSDEVVKRFANLHPKAPDFRIFWDNAYSVHHLYDEPQDNILEIVTEAEKANNPDIVYKFTSTSKISFPGSGIAALATSLNNIKDIEEWLKHQTIGHDKVNELRHARYFKDLDGIKAQMKKHAEILRPKFELIMKNLNNEVEEGLITFTHPHGGYFISLDCLKGVAKEVVALCDECGVKLTPAGSSFPYHKDPNNMNIRIAPSYPNLDELDIASHVLALAINICSLNKMKNYKN